MKSWHQQSLRLGIFFIVIIWLVAYYFTRPSTALAPDVIATPSICFDEHCFGLEIVTTDAEKAKWLMFRESLGATSGMLFRYDEPGVRYFWMKNTLIPLDIIWLDENWEVVYIENAQPCDESVTPRCPGFGPSQPVQHILEINGWMAQQKGIAIGDRWTFTKK